MNADDFRQFYEYHIAENRKIWDMYIMPLSQEQFTRPNNYSIGSVRDQIVHLMTVDRNWFSDLRRVEFPQEPDPVAFDDRKVIRAYWDNVEQYMRAYLSTLRDEMLHDKPLEGEDKDLVLWQVLLHVANHATDHRAQILRLLSDVGIKTGPQDYVFHLYEHPQQ